MSVPPHSGAAPWADAALPAVDGMAPPASRFRRRLERAGVAELRPQALTTLQVNVGRRCNQACRHCHVDASPLRTESMDDRVLEACLTALERSPRIETLDVTGGAPELHARFRELVARARALGRHVLVRHNLTVQFEPGQEGLVAFFAEQGVEVVSSLPHYTAEATDRQRGRGVYEASLQALRALNAAGYGRGGRLRLTLVSNPVGAFLPPRQEDLERDTRAYLSAEHGLHFDRLFTITNMPIARFAAWLRAMGQHEAYLDRLDAAFNPATLAGLMCRSLVSVGYDGRLYDCDFHQMVDLRLAPTAPATIFDFDAGALLARQVRLADHCLGCTAGAGSSCGGALA